MRFKVYRDNGNNSLSVINHIEKKTGYNFPLLFKEIMQSYDGLRLENDIFDFTNIYGKLDDRDINFCSFKEEYKTSFIVSEQMNINDLDNGGYTHLVAFGFCANGDYICFDYRDAPKGNDPKIVLVYHDDHIENEDGSLSMVVNFVANSFDEFMEMLHE